MQKSDVERLVGMEIPQERFDEALRMAEEKQRRIFSMTNDQNTMEPWYLLVLTKEIFFQNEFSRMTQDLCGQRDNMKKECPIKDQSTLHPTIL